MSKYMIGGNLLKLLRDIEAHFDYAPLELDLWTCPEEGYCQFQILVQQTEKLDSLQFIKKLQTVHRVYHQSIGSFISFNYAPIAEQSSNNESEKI